MGRRVDKAATKAARARQKAGIKRLDEAFRVPGFLQRWRGIPGFPMRASLGGIRYGGTPFRSNPKCPPTRTDAAWHRHRSRKAARAARRMNRR